MRANAYLLMVFWLLVSGCAQIVAPTGGPEDASPPEIVSEQPANLSKNFSSSKIEIAFNEFIQLDNTSEQVVISPPMRRMPSYQLKQKSLVIKFEEPLLPNTTYTINFGEAIKDNNEGNVLKNYTYVFSTGAVLDSMHVRGSLKDAISSEPVSNALVMLYKGSADSLPIDTIPDYFTRTGEDGRFSIEHVANQRCKIFALVDENSNYRFDVPSEQIGFIDSLIMPFPTGRMAQQDSSATDSSAIDLKTMKSSGGEVDHAIKMFVEDDTTQYLKRAYCEHYGKLVFVYNRPVRKFDVAIDGVSFKKQWAIKEFSSQRDTVTVWTTDLVPDTLLLFLKAGSTRSDTVELTMKPRTDELEVSSGKGKASRKKKVRFEVTGKTIPADRRSPKPNGPLQVVWSHPIVNMNVSRVTLYEDSIPVKFKLSSQDTALRAFDIQYKWKNKAKYYLLIADSAFTDIYGLWNDTLKMSFTGTDKEQFGELALKIAEKPQTPVVIEILSGGKLVESKAVSEAGIQQFGPYDPGKYDIRVVIDENANGRWDSGRYIQHRQPERLVVIQKGAEVRANWNLELEWNPNDLNQK